MGSVTHRPI
jgi:hypothetical protein